MDSLEILTFQNNKHKFPNHYHETYCITLIEKGVFGENELIAPTGSLAISHPYEVHHNKPVDDTACAFSTFYINEDIMQFISKSEFTSFKNKVIQDSFLFNRFKELVRISSDQSEGQGFDKKFYNDFYRNVFSLVKKHGHSAPYESTKTSVLMDDVRHFIKKHLNTRIELDTLAGLAGINKFKFIRWFKKQTGLTPFEYILLKRISRGKLLIQQGAPLADAAFETGFYDQSHFNKYFKHYVGMSPNTYLNNCNILQDISVEYV